jgi:hypothetical protein
MSFKFEKLAVSIAMNIAEGSRNSGAAKILEIIYYALPFTEGLMTVDRLPDKLLTVD